MLQVRHPAKIAKRAKRKLVHLPTKRFFIAHNPSFTKKYGKMLRPIYWVVRKNYSLLSSLSESEVFRSKPLGISIRRTQTGNCNGNNTALPLRIDCRGQAFFVKIGNTSSKRCFLALSRAQEYLAQPPKIRGFSVKVAMPHLLFEDFKTLRPARENELNSEHSFIVSDFFRAEDVVLLEDLRLKDLTSWDHSPISSAANAIATKLNSKGIGDVGVHNMFYNPRTKTIYLFDLTVGP